MNNTTMEEKQAYVSKLLSANQAAELMKSAFYDWIIPLTGDELRVGYGSFKPEDCHKALFFYVIEAASNIVANLRGDTDSEELLVVVMPEHPEKGVLVVDPAPWGRWEVMSEAVRIFCRIAALVNILTCRLLNHIAAVAMRLPRTRTSLWCTRKMTVTIALSCVKNLKSKGS